MRLIILGGGGYGRSVADLAEQLGYDPIIILDDKLPGLELDTFTSYINESTVFIPAFGNNEFRLSWIDRIQHTPNASLVTLSSNHAYVSPKSHIAPGTVILPGAIVNTECHIHTGCIVNIGSIVDHDVELRECTHLASGCVVKGENRLPRCTKIESGVVVERGEYKLD